MGHPSDKHIEDYVHVTATIISKVILIKVALELFFIAVMEDSLSTIL